MPLPIKYETTWNIFRRLNNKYKQRFIIKLSEYMKFKSDNLHEITGYFVWTSNSYNAYCIMKRIEKELK